MAHVIDCRSLSAKIRKKINDEIKGIIHNACARRRWSDDCYIAFN